MLLSETFGVERDKDFGVKGYSVTFKISTFLGKYEYLMYRWSAALDWKEAEGTTLYNVIAGAPGNIIHLPPPLTDEQREQLKAIWTMGGRYLAKDASGIVFCYKVRPVKDEIGWAVRVVDDFIELTYFVPAVACLVYWSDPEPFDIGKALGVGE